MCRLAQEDFAVFAARAAPVYVQDAERISSASHVRLLLDKAGPRIDKRDRAAILKHVHEHCAATTTKEKTQLAQWSRSSPEGWAERLGPLFAHQATSRTLSHALWETFCAHSPSSLGGSKLEEPVQCHVSIIAALLRHHLNVGNHHPHFVFDTHSSAAALQTGTAADGCPDLAYTVSKTLSMAKMLGQDECKKVDSSQWQLVRKKEKKRKNESKKESGKKRCNPPCLSSYPGSFLISLFFIGGL